MQLQQVPLLPRRGGGRHTARRRRAFALQHELLPPPRASRRRRDCAVFSVLELSLVRCPWPLGHSESRVRPEGRVRGLPQLSDQEFQLLPQPRQAAQVAVHEVEEDGSDARDGGAGEKEGVEQRPQYVVAHREQDGPERGAADLQGSREQLLLRAVEGAQADREPAELLLEVAITRGGCRTKLHQQRVRLCDDFLAAVLRVEQVAAGQERDEEHRVDRGRDEHEGGRNHGRAGGDAQARRRPLSVRAGEAQNDEQTDKAPDVERPHEVGLLELLEGRGNFRLFLLLIGRIVLARPSVNVAHDR
mmetsp:Transcript_13986/g.34575  ORF Transcript_13986/g.34575 Transcript_13986/m.34575 type:complete len:303 (-) Transcript_13986:1827-2735(-)